MRKLNTPSLGLRTRKATCASHDSFRARARRDFCIKKKMQNGVRSQVPHYLFQQYLCVLEMFRTIVQRISPFSIVVAVFLLLGCFSIGFQHPLLRVYSQYNTGKAEDDAFPENSSQPEPHVSNGCVTDSFSTQKALLQLVLFKLGTPEWIRICCTPTTKG